MTDTRLILEELRLIKEMFSFGTNKWHLLSINPKDLPPADPDYGCFSKDVLNQDGLVVWFNYKENRFENSAGENVIVKAWCEIPKYNTTGGNA